MFHWRFFVPNLQHQIYLCQFQYEQIFVERYLFLSQKKSHGVKEYFRSLFEIQM